MGLTLYEASVADNNFWTKLNKKILLNKIIVFVQKLLSRHCIFIERIVKKS